MCVGVCVCGGRGDAGRSAQQRCLLYMEVHKMAENTLVLLKEEARTLNLGWNPIKFAG